MLTQVELEQQMYAHGRARADRMMHNNEEGGRATNNPYAKILYRRFVLPLAEVIREDLAVKKAGAHKAHVKLLAPLDPEAVAFLAVRQTLNKLLNSTEGHGARVVVTAIGKSVYHELLLKLFEHVEPAMFHSIANDLDRRRSKNERHRMTVFKMQAKEMGIDFPDWGAAGTTQVGSYLINALEGLGLVVTTRTQENCRQGIDLEIAPEVLGLIDTVKGMVKETMPYFLPCVEQPKDWVTTSDGGWHTPEMRRLQPYAVAAQGAWSDVADHGAAVPLQAINALQRVRWQVNRDVFDLVKLVSKHFDMEEILCQAEVPAPPRPDWLDTGITKEAMNEAQLAEFTAWKNDKRDWHTQMKLRGTRYGRFSTAVRVAEQFVEYPTIYFVYFADFRGRLYANTTGISPQGSDLQKALLRFADGKPLDSTDAVTWFLVHGANKWGYDKDSLEGRVRWVNERQRMFLAFAEDPISNSGWREADCPLQFLAWCREYAEWVHAPHTFVSHLPVGMDGSCNGLQNFSAMLRDEVGGEATNLVPGLKPEDIYQRVADVVLLKLQQWTPLTLPEPDGTEERDKLIRKTAATNRFRELWLQHRPNRSLVKRSVMTLPYGSTRFSCSDFIVEDYLRPGKAPEFAREEYQSAATFLSHIVWDAIGEVVLKAREAMDWLQAAASKIIAAGHDDIRWTTPSGFPVIQGYAKMNSHRIRTSLCGNAFLRISVATEEADKAKHRNGIAPNFVHSLDASHLQLATVAASAEGIALAMIHDDYGTHAADCGRLARIIRETFVSMYENHDPLADLAARYDLPEPPMKGNLPLREVLNSVYFFS